jgi:hypothetical protein
MFSFAWPRRWRRSLGQMPRDLGAARRAKIVNGTQRFRLFLEKLESRLAPASFFVNAQLQISRLDNGGSASLSVNPSASQVVFFESGVANYHVLRQGLSPGIDSVVLDSAGDGVREMAAVLGAFHDLAAVGVVAHGAPGAVAFGTVTLDAKSLGNYFPELAVLHSSLRTGGEIDLWSCDVAAGQAGMSFVNDLAAAMAAPVAAASHPVGSREKGGDWQLDVRLGGAGAEVPFSAPSRTGFGKILGAWAPASNMAQPRAGQAAVLLNNGKVLLIGGSNDGSCVLYDPASNSWSVASSMATSRSGFTATLLGNGKVLVAGGAQGSSAELYDPVKDAWSSAGSMAVARSLHTATLLKNGKVLVAGGAANGALSSAELYDAVSNSWSPAGSLITGRYDHTATLLTNGNVLVAGG